MQWSLLLTRTIFVAVLCFSAASNAVAQGTQIQGPRDAADVYSGVVYGPIDQSDTLWAISGQYRKNQQFTVYQVMLAIYELNPRAFVNRNFNTMVNGSMLKLPTDRYIARIDPARARAKAEAERAAQYGATNYGRGSDGQQSYSNMGTQGFGVSATGGGPVSNKTGRGRTDYMKGGRAGYFFGGRVNYKTGGRVSFKNGGLASIL